MMPDELREAVARAIYEEKGLHRSTGREWPKATPGDRYDHLRFADAALAAIREAGFALVPVVPTEVMLKAGADTVAALEAGLNRFSSNIAIDAAAIWYAMLEAAQEGKP